MSKGRVHQPDQRRASRRENQGIISRVRLPSRVGKTGECRRPRRRRVRVGQRAARHRHHLALRWCISSRFLPLRTLWHTTRTTPRSRNCISTIAHLAWDRQQRPLRALLLLLLLLLHRERPRQHHPRTTRIRLHPLRCSRFIMCRTARRLCRRNFRRAQSGAKRALLRRWRVARAERAERATMPNPTTTWSRPKVALAI